MKIFKDNLFKNLQNVVEIKAKFQKVLLIYDENVTEIMITKIYETIKLNCVFNKVEINNLPKIEINNGYKLLVFACSAKNFFNLNFNFSDFICFFIPTDSNYLPFFINENNRLESKNNYLFLSENFIDEKIVFSCLFNRVVASLNAMIFDNTINLKQLDLMQITQKNLFDVLNEFENENFEDFKILKQLKLDYETLPIIDYILLLAFDTLATAIREKNLAITDIYKNLKNDYVKINKYYNLISSQVFIQVIDFNYVFLSNLLKQSLKTINNIFNLKNYFNGYNPQTIINNLKEYSKNADILFNYLFLFNVFG